MTRPKMFAIWLAVALGGSTTVAFLFADGWAGQHARALTIAHMLPVLLATLFVQGPLLKQPVLAPLGLKLSLNRWFLVAWLSPVLVLAFGLLAAWLLFGVDPVLDVATYVEHKRAIVPAEHLEEFERILRESPPPRPLWFWLIVQGLPAGITINLLVSLATEVGFRGFLFREVQGGFWQRSLVIGLVEAMWLAPAVAFGLHFPTNPQLGLGAITLFCVVLSPVLVVIRVRSESTIAVAAMRGTMLALTVAATDFTFGAEDWQRPFYGVAGAVGLAFLLGVFVVHDRFFAKRSLMFPAQA
ncbi:MAG: CPBP family glutamic-type intramembrane protease [Myxococcota bacterium]